MSPKKIFVSGGAGFVGSHVNKMLHQTGYDTVVFDNLSQGNAQAVTNGTLIEGDLKNREELEKVFSHHKFDAVMHFAALIDVGESIQNPLKYYLHNVSYTLNLLEVMKYSGVNTFIFSSSAAIFGNPQMAQITEDHPCHPINPYGKSKLMVENILSDVDRANGIKFCSLRYFNAAGGDPEGQIKNIKPKETNLIPILLRKLKSSKNNSVTIFGTDYPTPDGTCIRDYIHVCDLASAHIKAMEKLWKDKESTAYNLGTGQGYSVREVIEAAQKITKRHLAVIEGQRRPGDPPFLVADSQKAHQKLGWRPLYPSLEIMIEHAWKALS